MVKNHRFPSIVVGVSTACAFVALSPRVLAQVKPASVECKKTETQAECHARLKCKANEELEDCQKRLLKCRTNEELDDCEERVGAKEKEGRGGRRDDADRTGRDRDDDADRDSRARGDRDDDHDRGGRTRGDRDDDYDRGRRTRGDRDDDHDRGRRTRGGGRRHDGRRRGRGDGSKGFQANKTFGLGVELGEPTGINGKYFFSDKAAFDFGIGWIYSHYYYDDGLHLYADFLYHPTSLASTHAFELPLYIGVGLRYWDFEYCDGNICDYHGSVFGLRIPFGMAFDFNNVPLDIFIQIVPVIDSVYGDYYDRHHDRAHLGIDLSLGIRFWFN